MSTAMSNCFAPCLVLAAAMLSPCAAYAQGQLVRDDIAQRALACMSCHSENATAGPGYFPRIAGKPAGYLHKQLLNFRDGRRRYPAMNGLLANLSDDYLAELATYFSDLHQPYPRQAPGKLAPATVELGRRLVVQGDAARGIPACVSCHGAGMNGAGAAIPGLIGLPGSYIKAQFGAWKTGARKAAEPDCMRQLSRQLSPTDIEAVSAWLSAQPAPSRAAPRAALSAPLPMPCGSVSQ